MVPRQLGRISSQHDPCNPSRRAAWQPLHTHACGCPWSVPAPAWQSWRAAYGDGDHHVDRSMVRWREMMIMYNRMVGKAIKASSTRITLSSIQRRVIAGGQPQSDAQDECHSHRDRSQDQDRACPVSQPRPIHLFPGCRSQTSAQPTAPVYGLEIILFIRAYPGSIQRGQYGDHHPKQHDAQADRWRFSRRRSARRIL